MAQLTYRMTFTLDTAEATDPANITQQVTALLEVDMTRIAGVTAVVVDEFVPESVTD